MSAPAILSPVVTEPTTVEVLPAQTALAEWDVKFDDILCVQVENLDETQDFVGKIQRKLHEDNDWADSNLADLSTVPSGTGKVVDCDVRATRALRVVGAMSGAGGNVRVTAVRRAASR